MDNVEIEEQLKEDEVKVLNRLLAEDRELLQLTTRLSKFNPFKILAVKDYEIRHSNMLGWLMDPEESHGLGDKFLRHFLSSSLQYNIEHSNSSALPIQPFEVQLATISDVSVKREYNNFDMFIEIPSMKLLVLIENKIHSKESTNQLSKYYKKILSEYYLGENPWGLKELKPDEVDKYEARRGEPEWKFYGIYLTLQGDSPETGENYFPFTYRGIRKDIQLLLDLNPNISSPIRSFIENYIEILDELTINEQDEDIKIAQEIHSKHKDAIALVSKIKAPKNHKILGVRTQQLLKTYQKHKQALDLVNKVGDRVMRDRILSYLESKYPERFELLFSTPNVTLLLPKEWLSLAKRLKLQNGWSHPKIKNLNIPMWLWFWHKSNEDWLGIIIEVGEGDSFEGREELLNKFRQLDEGILRKFTTKEGSKYTRIYSEYTKGRNKNSIVKLFEGDAEANKIGAFTVVEKLSSCLEDFI